MRKHRINTKRLVKMVFIIIIFSLFIVSCSSKQDTGEYSQEAPEPIDGIDIPYHIPVSPLDVVLIIDQSSSMSGFANFSATDPDQWRIKASHYMVSNIAAKRTTYSIPRFGVVHFGTDAPGDLSVPLTYMHDNSDVQEIIRGIVTLDLNWTNFSAALEETLLLFEQGNTFEDKRNAAVILLTDGEPSDPRNLTSAQYFQEISSLINPTFRDYGIDLFVIGIDAADMSWSNNYASWLELLPTENSAVFNLKDMKDLRGVFNEIARVLFDVAGGEPELVSGPDELEFEIPAYLERVEFHVFSDDPGLVLNVIRPDGSIISESDPDIIIDHGETFSIIIAISPEPGTWGYRIEQGRGAIEVYRNLVPVKLRMLQPRSQIILGLEQEIIVEFIRQDETPVLRHPDYPIQIELSIEGPGIRKDRLIMQQIDEGLYTVDTLFTPVNGGVHKFVLSVQAPGAFSYSDEFNVEVIQMPYLVPVTPVEGSEIRAGNELYVEVDIFANFEPVNFDDYFSTRDTALVIAWSQAEGKELSPAYYLYPTGEPGRLGGLIPYDVSRGSNQVRFKIVGDLISGEPYPGEELLVSFTGVVPFWIEYGPYAIALIVLTLTIYIVSYIRRPAWTGSLSIENTINPLESPGDIDLALFGKKKKLTLGKRAMIPLETTDDQNISGNIVLVKQPIDEFDQGLERWGLKIDFQINTGEHQSTATLVRHNDSVQIGPFLIKYHEH